MTDSRQLPATISAGGLQVRGIDDLSRLAKAVAESGYFKDANTPQKVAVKMLYAMTMGFDPIAGLQGVDLIDGAPTPNAHFWAAAIEDSPLYDFEVLERSNERCTIAFFRRQPDGTWRRRGEVTWTIDDARAAKLAGKDNWQKYPRAMLYARAMTEGGRAFCPGLFGGVRAYAPEELNPDEPVSDFDLDYETGEVIEVPSGSTPSPTDGAADGESAGAPQLRGVPGGDSRPAAEVSHLKGPENPDHALHTLWAIFRDYGLKWTPVWRDKAFEVLKDAGIGSGLAVKEREEDARAILRRAFNVTPKARVTVEVDSKSRNGRVYDVELTRYGDESSATCQCEWFTFNSVCGHIVEAWASLGLDDMNNPPLFDHKPWEGFDVSAAMEQARVDYEHSRAEAKLRKGDGNAAADRAAEKAGLVPVPGGEAA